MFGVACVGVEFVSPEVGFGFHPFGVGEVDGFVLVDCVFDGDGEVGECDELFIFGVFCEFEVGVGFDGGGDFDAVLAEDIFEGSVVGVIVLVVDDHGGEGCARDD